MKKKIVLACLCGVAVFASQGAMASGIKVRGGVTNNNYTTDFDPAPTLGNPYAKSSFSGTSFGLTWLIDDSMYIDYALSNGSGTRESPLSSTVTLSTELTRTDNAIILGSTSVSGSGNASNLYFGWKNGETKMAAPPLVVSGITTTQQARNFTTSGFIFGGGVGIPAGGGSVGLSLGMGIMSGEYKYVSPTTTTTNTADMALGFSYGIGYTYGFTPNFGASVDYKGNVYKYTFNSGLSSEWSLTENLTTTSVSLFAKF